VPGNKVTVVVNC